MSLPCTLASSLRPSPCTCRLVLLQPKFYKPRSTDQHEPGVLFGPTHIVELYTELLQEGLAARQ